MKRVVGLKLLLVMLALTLCLALTACNGDATATDVNTSTNDITDTSNTTTAADNTAQTGDGTDITDNSGDNTGEIPEYYIASVKANSYVVASPYIGDSSVSDELDGVYYSASAPGGEPESDGTGKIWLKLIPLKKYTVFSVDVTGTYSKVESLGDDLYCISGVKSNLSVSIMMKALPDSTEKIFDSYGYGISDDGALTVTWEQSADTPLRYVEVSYLGDNGYKTEYIDAALGGAELLQMEENKAYTVSLRAVGYDNIGKRVDISAYYTNKPKEVSFPRVEIITENYLLPSFDNAVKPSNGMGAGITNANYEQCTITLYNENNEVVYSSYTDGNSENEYLGAKIKVRGNTSAAHAKGGRYPYKIKLKEKADLLEPYIDRTDDGKAYADREWLLLNYGDELYRVCGDAIADAVGTEWSPDYCYVSLYINGDYRGLYVLSEPVERGNGEGETQARIPVDNDGFVFECDAYWWNEPLYFDTPMTRNTKMYFTFKYPDSDKLTKDSPQVTYLRDYIISFETALKKNDDSYLDYIDLDSFVKWLLVTDYLSITDGGGCNIFMYKKDSTDGTKLMMGPNWDFDSYMGNAEGLSTIRMYWNTAPFYYHQLIKKSSFQTRYNELFTQTREELDSYIEDAYSKIDMEAHSKLLEYQNIRFGTSLKPLNEQKEEFDAWLDEHLAWMCTQFE